MIEFYDVVGPADSQPGLLVSKEVVFRRAGMTIFSFCGLVRLRIGIIR